MTNETKILAVADFKANPEGAGSFSGYGAVFNNVDSYGDVILPGAFKKTIKTFLKSGFNVVGHEWSDLPIAFPTEAHEDAKGLMLTAAFHSTNAAQAARTVMFERAAAGLDVGLSIGYRTVNSEMVSKDDKRILALGIDPNTPTMWGDQYRLLKQVDLFEVSYVTAPANTSATATAVKGVDEFGALIAFMDEFKAGRVMSGKNQEQMHALMGTLGDLHTATCDMGDDCPSGPPKKKDAPLAVRALAAVTRARFIGAIN